MRAVYLFHDSRSADGVVVFPPPVRTVLSGNRKKKTFKLMRGTWEPTRDSQLAVYLEVVPRSQMTKARPPVAVGATVDRDPGDER